MKFLAVLFIAFAVYSTTASAKFTAYDTGAKSDSIYRLPGKQLISMAKKLLYKKTPQEDMYLYVLHPEGKPKKPLPAIIYYTGGGWVNGDVADEIPTAAWFRDHGMIGITADYRVKGRHGTTPLEAIKDARSAMRYVRGHAKDLGIDPDMIIAAGGSAGGHLAICTFLNSGDDSADNLSISCKPNGLVLHNPVLGEGYGLDFLNEHPEFTPLKQVGVNWPPTILSCGTKDGTTPYSGALRFTQLMHEKGNTCELITVKDADHSCDWPLSNPNFLPTLTRMVAFLQEQQLCPEKNNWKPYISLEKYTVPFWKADTVYDEISQAISKTNEPEATLLFKAKKILSVTSADKTKQFVEGKDWQYTNGKFQLSAGSSIPYFKQSDLLYNIDKPGWSMTGKVKGTYVLFSESTFFWENQIAITYIPEKEEKWKGPAPVFAQKSLSETISRLKGKKNLNIVFFGNSIETGCNSSGFQNISPYMPSWPELIVHNLRSNYEGNIRYSNPSVGGMLAQWGKDNADSLVASASPNLVIIGFGMNDGTFGVHYATYIANIKGIMNAVLAKNPKAEFILIATMLANPDAMQNNIQASYKSELEKLAKKGVVIANITDVHTELLKHKTYQDMTGNNVNHPNDYLVRWYAQYISGLLIK